MVKSVLSVSHQGLRDWVIQRISALIIGIYTLALAYFFFAHPQFGYTQWHSLFSTTWMKVATLVVVISLLCHAWVGIWTVLTDYVKPAALRFILDVSIYLTLLACFIWASLIVWSV